jgi:PLP dependent protein
MIKIAERVKCLRENISSVCARVGRDPAEIKLVVVTKSASQEAIEEVVRLGFSEFGENRVQQLKKVVTDVDEFIKHNANEPGMPRKVNWHMIGHLQRNKVRQVLPMVTLIHSVDTLRLAEEISIAAAKMNIVSRVLLQVNTSEESQKYGVPVGAALHLAEQIDTLPNIKMVGLMTMGPLTHNKDVTRKCFTRARELFLEMKGERVVGQNFDELSMGMSSDYEIAVEQGATILRIGSAIFSG